jgi:hypothetical protein
LVGHFLDQNARSPSAHGNGFNLSVKVNKVMTTVSKPTTSQASGVVTSKAQQGRYKIKSPSRGGARPGAGRPKGSTALITARTLVEAIENEAGKPFEVMLAEGYVDAVHNGDHKTRLEYERMILGKVVSDRTSVEVVESEDLAAQKAQAFAEALLALNTQVTSGPTA